MAVIFALIFTIVVGMVLAGLVIGRTSIVRRELQSAADAAALAGAYSIEQNGKPMNAPIWGPAQPIISKNTNLTMAAPAFRHQHRSNPPLSPIYENRVVVTVDLTGSFDTAQTWFQRMFTIRARAHAQVNEQVFSQDWPALTIILDASQSMSYPILAGTGRPAFDVMSDVLTSYAANTLPVRNGLVIFSTTVMRTVAPPTSNANNLTAISNAFLGIGPNGQTNTEGALRAARDQQEVVNTGRNVLLITDGEPTRSIPPECGPANDPCHFQAAEDESVILRNDADSALFTTEIRRTNYTTQTTTFLQNISGPKDSPGGDTAYVVPSVAGPLGIRNFLLTLTASVCAFGPLDPDAGAPPDGFRPRATTPDLLVWTPSGDLARQRVFAYIREGGGHEQAIQPVPDRDAATGEGFQLVVVPGRGHFIVLTLASCNVLGGHWARTLVVRWDDPQLVPAP